MISKEEYFLELAVTASKRSKCLRRQYGAVLVKDDRVVSTGYNGPAKGEPHCITCKREGREHNAQYDSTCPAVHAEANAVIYAGREANGSTLYLAGFSNGERIRFPEPCEMCRRMLINAGIKAVVV